MDLGASQQCVLFGWNFFLKNYSELLNHSYFSKLIMSIKCWFFFFFCNIWFYMIIVLFNQNCLKIGCFVVKVLRPNEYLEVLFWKSGAYKSKYTLKHLLSQKMVHLTKTTKSGSMFKVLGKKIVLPNRCINICPEKYNLGNVLWTAKMLPS